MQLLPDFGKPGTNAHLDNRMNEDFARRLALSGILSLLVFLVIGALLVIPVVALFGKIIGAVIILNLYCLVIAVIADVLHLMPFPVIEILRNRHAPGRRTECKAQVRQSIHALPLSFIAAAFWCSLLSKILDDAIPFLLILYLISPLTVMTTIVAADCKSPERSFFRSALAFFIVCLAAGIMFPGW